MTGRVRIAVVGIVVGLVAAGCASPRVAQVPPPAPETTLRGTAALDDIDPCALLTRAEVSRVLGTSVGPPTRRKAAPLPICVWRGSGDKSKYTASVQLAPVWLFEQTGRLPEHNESMPISARTGALPIGGVGDAAYAITLDDQKPTWGYGGDLVAVRVGDVSAFVSADEPFLGSEKSLERATELARAVAPRLEGT